MEQGGEETRRLWDCSDQVIGALIEVHRHLGAGLLELAYGSSASHELTFRGMSFERQRPMPLMYKGISLECGDRIDLVVGSSVLVELKAVEALLPAHLAQVITYLRLSRLPVGLLVNFNARVLRQG